MIRYVVGDATRPQGDGPKVVAHVCNDVGAFGAGFAAALLARWPGLAEAYRTVLPKSPRARLGSVSAYVTPEYTVVNMVAQHGLPGPENRKPCRLDALTWCLAKAAGVALDLKASLHMPRIGTGYGGQAWGDVEPLVEFEVCGKGVPVFVYDLPEGQKS